MAGGGSVQKNKSHKTRFASKSQRTKHRLAKETVTAPSGRAQKHAGVHVTARAQRLNSAKVMREQKRAETLASKRSSSGPLSPPRILLLIGLNEQTDLGKLKAALLAACLSSSDDATSLGSVRVSKPPEEDTAMETDAGVDAGAGAGAGEVLPAEEGGQVAGLGGAVTVAVLKHKLRLTLLEASHGDAMGCLEKMKGVPSLVGLVQGLASVPPKRRAEAKKGALAALHEQFPDDCRGFPVDLPEDCQQVRGGMAVGVGVDGGGQMRGMAVGVGVGTGGGGHGIWEGAGGASVGDGGWVGGRLLRHLAEQRLSPPTWRTQRSYVVAHKVEYEASGDVPGSGSLLVSGYVRYKALSVNQIEKVATIFLQFCLHLQELAQWRLAARFLSRIDNIFLTPKRRALVRVHVSGAGDFHLAEVRGPDDPCPLQRRQRKKRAADVHMGEAELDGSSPVLATADPDLQEPIVVENAPDPLAGEQTWPTEEEMEAAGEERRKQGGGGKKKRVPKGTSDYQEDEDMTAAEREAERQRLKAAHQDDVEFPDEVDTPGDVAARQRFAKYRGLKSFRTSPWDSKNFKRTQKHVLAKAADVDLGRAPGCVFPGTFVTLRIASVPQALADKVAAEAARGQPVVVAALLQHETKMSVVHYAVRKSDTWQEPVRSKDELLFHSGFRRFSARWGKGGGPVRVSAPPPGGAAPPPALVATGALRGVDVDRIILKKIVLSGYPVSVQKRKAVVRFMFHTPEDVRWFKNFKRTQKHVLAKAADVDLGRAPGCVFPGTFVTLRIASVPQALADKVAAEAARGQPVVVAALLQHETKMSVVHYAVRKSDTWQEPVRSKDELLFHSGFRRFSARWGKGGGPVRVSAPPPGGAAPPPALVATGALRGVDVDRIILKKIVLSGYPVSVQKRKAVVRFMFHTPEDVRWFKPVELFTKYGRRGRIKEPVGTKGNMKCIFDGTVQQRDAVLLALYKRIYPKWPEALYC
eukprot:jgi/Mesen1/3682/ME000202S02777